MTVLKTLIELKLKIFFVNKKKKKKCALKPEAFSI